MKVYKRILCVSDLHFPYTHKDVFAFLKGLKKKYKPDLVVLLGDEVDYHGLSFHDSDPDLDSSGKELEKALGYMETLYGIFPAAKVLESNHGSMAYRKAKHHGMPRHLLRSYKEVLAAPKEWNWYPTLTINSPAGKIFFAHGYRANSISESQRLGMNFIQGHHHSQLDIRYWCNTENKYFFGATVGCMIDDKSYAFAYNKNCTKRPIMSHMFIDNGVPKPLPMFMTPKGRWNKVLP